VQPGQISRPLEHVERHNLGGIVGKELDPWIARRHWLSGAKAREKQRQKTEGSFHGALREGAGESGEPAGT